MTFIDCYSKTTWLTLLKAKSDVLTAFKTVYQLIETRFGTRIKAIRTDNRTEYTNIAFQEFLRSHGVHQKTVSILLRKVGLPNERIMRRVSILFEVARSLLFTMNVSKYL